MPDREKVIKELEWQINVFTSYCASDDRLLEAIKAALALLKEQEMEIENLKQTAQSMMEGIVVSTPMFYPCPNCQEFNCDFCKYKEIERR